MRKLNIKISRKWINDLLNKLLVFLLIQLMLGSQLAWAGSEQLEKYTLSPKLNINNYLLQGSVLGFTDIQKPGLPKEAELNSAQPEVNVKKIKDEILFNDLIQNFFRLDISRKIPWSYLLFEIFEKNSSMGAEVITLIESKGEVWIAQHGEIIRETHSSRSSYPEATSDGSWDSFINKNSGVDTYNLAHLLAHSIGFVNNYLEIEEIEKAKEFLKTGYIILRAIEIESRNRSDIATSEQSETILSNNLISMYFERGKNLVGDENPMVLIIRELMKNQDPLFLDIRNEVDAKSKVWIDAEGLRILKDFFANSAYKQFSKVDNWSDFVAIQTKGLYDLQQLLVHTLGTANLNYQYLKISGSESDYYAEQEQLFKEMFRVGYIILRAIDLAAQEDQKNKYDFLPQVELEKLSQDQAFIMIDKVKNCFEEKNITFLNELACEEAI